MRTPLIYAFNPSLSRVLGTALLGFSILAGPSGCDKGKEDGKDSMSKAAKEKSANDEARVASVCKAACTEKQTDCSEPVFDGDEDKCDEMCEEKFEEMLGDLKIDKCAQATADFMECAFGLSCSLATSIYDDLLEGKSGKADDCTPEAMVMDDVCGFDFSDMDDTKISIGGEDWDKAYGVVVEAVDGKMRLVLTDDSDVDCDTDLGDLSDSISLTIASKEGESVGVKVKFVSGGVTVADGEASVFIETISADEIEGALVASVSDTDLFVGEFELSSCL